MSTPSMALANDLPDIERDRLRNLVTFDMAASLARHADDFQLINPMGLALTRDDYLGALEAGTLIYHVFEPVSGIEVRTCGDNGAAVRYRSHIDVEFEGQRSHSRLYWHTDLYERRDGEWQVVWSQATAVT